MLAGLALLAAGPAPAAASSDTAELVSSARADLGRGDGIAAEVKLRRALTAGAPRPTIAAYMGEAMIDQGRDDRALEWLAPAEFDEATAAVGFRLLAQVQHRAGKFAEAKRAVERSLALAPDVAGTWVDMGHVHYALAEHRQAIAASDKALRIDPADPRALLFRGQIVRDQFGLAAGLPWFEAGLARSPDDLLLLGECAATLGELGRARQMLTLTRRMLQIDSGNPRAFYLQAVLAARAGNTGLARSMLAKAERRPGKPAGAFLLAAVLDLRAGNPVLAIESLENLLGLQPGNVRARMLLARALFEAGQYRQLLDRFSPAAGRTDASPYLLTLLGRAQEMLGRRELAAGFLDKAARAQPPAVHVVFDGSPLGALVSSSRTGEAAAIVARNLADNPDSASNQTQAGDAAFIRGDAAQALRHYREAAKIRLPESLLLRTVAAMGQGGEARAIPATVEAYLAQNPTSPMAARLVAQLAATAGDWRRARSLLENVADWPGGRDARLLAELSLAQLRDGDAPAAEKSARAAYLLQPSNPLAAQAWGKSLTGIGSRPRVASALLDKARVLGGDNQLVRETRALLSER